MSIKITVSDTVKFKVSGTIANENGPTPFDFTLLAKRLDTDELKTRLEDSEASIADFLVEVVTGWSGVKGDEGELPYTEAGLRQLLKIPGLAALALRAYFEDCGAKAKN
jgi:hypothetical protein